MWPFLLAVSAMGVAAWVAVRGARGGSSTIADALWPIGVGPPAPHIDGLVKTRVNEYRRICERYADAYRDLTPEILLAVITRESQGDPTAVGDSGRSVGLMQIGVAAWQDYQQATGDPTTTPYPDGIVSPENNIRVGSWYLQHMINLTGSLREGLRAYNGGYTATRDNPTLSADYAAFVMAARDEFNA